MKYENNIEENLLGNIALHPNLIPQIILPDDCFFDNYNKFIFRLIKQQYNDVKTFDLQALIQNYKHLFNAKYNISIIVEKITIMISNCSTIRNLNYLQETLFNRYIDKKIIESINKFQKNQISNEDLLNDIHKYESMNINTEQGKLSYYEILKLITSNNKVINLKFKKLSDFANIQEHDFVVIAARPGLGKSGFILNLIEDLSDNYNCILFNLEMSEKSVYQRLVGIHSQIGIRYLDNPVTDYQKGMIEKAVRDISNKKIRIISQSQTIQSIRRNIINETKDEHTLIFIDYVGLINSLDRYPNLYEKVTSIVKELRTISLDYNCTIFLVSQIGRNSEKQKDKMPLISDLKESGELEQSATHVIMLHDENHDKLSKNEEIEMSIILGKNRNGRVGKTKLIYNRSNQNFKEVK